MKTILAILITLSVIGACLAQEEDVIPGQAGRVFRLEGTLTFNTQGDDTFYAITVETPVQIQGANGDPIICRKLQVAGLDAAHWASYKPLIGKQVRIQGRLMQAETRYHHTPILIITNQITPID